MANKKIFARQVETEIQSSPLMNLDEWPDDLAVTGNSEKRTHIPKLFGEVRDVLENGEMFEVLEDVKKGGEEFGYKTATEAINAFLSRYSKKEKFPPREIHRIKVLVEEYDKGHYSFDECKILCDFISVVTGVKWGFRNIYGDSQSDWNRIFYVEENWSEKALKGFETEYFNTGTEWIVHDGGDAPEGPEDIRGHGCYCHGWNDEQIRAEIAEMEEVKPEEVVLYFLEGFRLIPVYREVV